MGVLLVNFAKAIHLQSYRKQGANDLKNQRLGPGFRGEGPLQDARDVT